jgi:hypothetical protein
MRRNPPDVDHDVLRQGIDETLIVSGDQDEIRSVRTEPAPYHVRFDVLAIRDA